MLIICRMFSLTCFFLTNNLILFTDVWFESVHLLNCLWIRKMLFPSHFRAVKITDSSCFDYMNFHKVELEFPALLFHRNPYIIYAKLTQKSDSSLFTLQALATTDIYVSMYVRVYIRTYVEEICMCIKHFNLILLVRLLYSVLETI